MSVTLKDLGGQKEVLMELMQVFLHLTTPEIDEILGVRSPSRICLHGPRGCGKTYLVRAFSRELILPCIEVNVIDLLTGNYGEPEEKIIKVFEAALKCIPCIVFFDQFEAVRPRIETGDNTISSRIVSQLCNSLYDLGNKDGYNQIKIIFCTSELASIDQSISRFFETEIIMGMPNKVSRLEILNILCKELKLSEDFDMIWLAHHTPGFVAEDLRRLVVEATKFGIWRTCEKFAIEYCGQTKMQSEHGNNPCLPANSFNTGQSSFDAVLTWCKCKPKIPESQLKETCYELEDFKAALQKCTPFSKKCGFGITTSIKWDDVGALREVKKQLKAIISCLEHKEVCKGILLFGPKGCGKTLLTKALADKFGVNILAVKGPELYSISVENTENNIRQVFLNARYAAPCVVVFDEFDSMSLPRTGSNVKPEFLHIMRVLLTLMDELGEMKDVVIICTTNRIDLVDSEMLKPKRLAKVIYVDLPSPAERVEILEAITKNIKTENLDLKQVALDARCENFSGADLVYLCNEAFIRAMAPKKHPDDSSSQALVVLQKEHFHSALEVVKASITEQEKEYFKMCQKKYKL